MAFCENGIYCVKITVIIHILLVLLTDVHRILAQTSTQANSDAPVLRSCWELKLAGYLRDGEYNIDPDGPEKGEELFKVYCDMDTGTSMVYHDRLNRGLVPRGFEDKGNFRAPVTYSDANMKQLKTLADISGNCSQMISLECLNVLMWYEEDAWTWWVSRDGVQMNNWGSPTGTEGCLCSIDESCDRGRERCNCDSNDGRWRMDRGLLTDKRTLPVKEMRFGDSQGGQELAIFRLGEFKCTGQDQPLYSSCSALADAGYHARGAYLVNVSSSTEEAAGRTMVEVVECKERDEPADNPPPMESCTALREAGYRTDGMYTIDPDGPGVGVLPFSIQCYLSSDLTPPIMKSCADLMIAGYSISKEYLIDPDGPDNGVEPFAVFCDLSTGTSIIHHDQIAFTTVPFGYEQDGEYRVPIHYDVDMEQIVALIDSSKTCRQYLALDCHHVLIWHNEDLINWWVSRDGKKMSNWASPTGTVGCTCSISNSCDNGESRCNCDVNDLVWRKDDGYLTDRSTLPITELRLSDTDHPSEQVFYTIGNLECEGFDADDTPSKKSEGKPLTPKDDRPSSNPSSNTPNSKGSSSASEGELATCPNKSSYTGLVTGIILITIVVLILLVILVIHWYNNKHLKLTAYRSGVI